MTETLVPQHRSSLHSDSSLAVSAAEPPDRRPRPRRRGPGSDLEPLTERTRPAQAVAQRGSGPQVFVAWRRVAEDRWHWRGVLPYGD
jgi:hypothetical protein